MTSLRRALGATLLCGLLLSGCSEADEPSSRENSSDVDASGRDASSAGLADLAVPETSVDEDAVARPQVPAPVVAMKFQQGLYEGQRNACNLLTETGRATIAEQQIAAGRLDEGSTCRDYVKVVASNYPDESPKVTSQLLQETNDRATVRVEMLVDGSPAETTMQLKIVDGAWLIHDWGTH